MLKKNIYAALAAVAVAVVVLAFTTAIVLAQLEPVDITPATVTGSEPRGDAGRPAAHAAQNPGTTSTRSPLPSEQAGRDKAVDQPLSAAQRNATPAFNADAIFDATQKVRVDAQGNVVLDHDTMVLLQNTLGQQDLQMDELALAELKDLVEYAMPGSAGAQVAVIAGNYYEFLRAKAAYEELANDAGSTENYEYRENYEDRQRQIQLLRETYLGAEVANSLFAQTDAENELMRASIALSVDVSLSDEERQQQLAEIKQEYVERVLSANGWSHRYQQFMQQKSALLAAGNRGETISDGELAAADNEAQEQAITELWHTHFTAEEREKMMALHIPVL